MDVIDRYFRTLRVLLPKDQRDDIIRELSEEVRSQIADQEATLGRPLTSEEQATIVGQYGHPLLTAARYRPQRYLIGPVVFPHYWLALKVIVGLTLLGHAASALMLLASGSSMAQLGPTLTAAFTNVLKIVGWLTALAAWLDLWLSRSNVLKNWRPDIMSRPSPRVPNAVESAMRKLPASSRLSRSSEPSLAGFVIGVLVSAWWLAGLRFPALLFGPGASALEWGPAMDRMYPVLVAGQLALLAEQLVRLRARESTVTLGLLRVVWLVAGWSLIYLVATTDHQWMTWVAAAPEGTEPVRIAGRDVPLLDFVNLIWSTIFVFVAIVCAWSSVKGILRRLRGTPKPAHA